MKDVGETRKILIIDDSAEYRNLCEKIIASARQDSKYKLETTSCATSEEGLESFKNSNPDLVLLDVNLPGISGFELLRQFRKLTHKKAHVGIIFITGNNTPEFAQKSLELGADDFCCKINFATELIARIISVLNFKKSNDALMAANEKLRQANERLAKITITDDLTGLHNMKYFKKRLVQEYTRADRYDKFLSIIMFDVDNFKRVNDTSDHLMGSYVLGELGKMVTEQIRTVDIGARFGGDEYVVMLPETGVSGAYNAAERISQKVADRTFDNGINQMDITLSIGVATLGPGSEKFESGTDLLRRADHYLYEAKETGRNKIIDAERSTRNQFQESTDNSSGDESSNTNEGK